MNRLSLACPLVALALGCAGTNENLVRQNLNSWTGQMESAVTGAFGYPQKTVDLAAGAKVYHYDFGKGCAVDFDIGSTSVVNSVHVSGDDLSACPHKLPGGGQF